MAEKRKLKIAILSFYSGLINRGVETFAHELGNKLIELGHDVTIFQGAAGNVNQDYKTEVITTKVDLNRQTNDAYLAPLLLDYWARKIFSFSLKAARNVGNEKFDIVVPLNGGWQSIIIRLVTCFTRSKMVISGQAGPGRDDRYNLYTFPDAFVGFSQFQCDWARRKNSKVKVVKIPNGVDLEKFKKEGDKLKISLPRPVIMISAALVKMKRMDLTIKAVSKMKNSSLFIVGQGREKENLNKLGNKLLPGRFKIIEATYSDMAKTYRAADLFTFPTSPWESFGIVMLEAMASGLPVVAADDPIRREIVGEGGITVDVTDVEKYAKVLEKALDTNWGEKPRRQAEKFSWDNVAKKYEELFLSLTR